MQKSIVENIDCMIAMRNFPDKFFDLAIVDPQYGIGESRRTQSRPTTAKQANGSRLYVSTARKHKVSDWDDERPGPEYFEELQRVSRNQIIWGGNHFADLLPARSGWVVWDKVNPGSDQSDCELAWTSFKIGVRQIEFMWNGMIQGKSLSEGRIAQGDKSKNEPRIHPTHKPMLLYRWLLQNYAKSGDRILDTHLGGGSSRIAAHDLGYEFYGYELDPDYFEAQEKRFAQHISQLTLQL